MVHLFYRGGICFILLVLLPTLTYAQQTREIILKGVIQDDSLQRITDVQVQITGAKTKLIYFFRNLQDQSEYEIPLQLPASIDTLWIKFSHMAYADTLLVVPLRADQQVYTQDVRLSLQTRFLEDVTINGPPIWRRGDTTIYRADFFKDGDERKLKDLLENLPDFQLRDDQLLFKGKPVDKIKIEGEELFADRIAMLLNSFPVHPIEHVEVMEKQSLNALLSGLDGDERVFVNLTIKKDVFVGGFGDAELGYGVGNRHLMSSVLFSILKKIKAGYVGNWNSVGDVVETDFRSSLQRGHERKGNEWLMPGRNLSLISDLDRRYFVQNNLLDHRMQINVPLGKHSSKTEINFMQDRLRQYTDLQAYRFDGMNYVQSQDSTQIQVQPFQTQLVQTFTINPDAKSQWIMEGIWYLNRNKSNHERNFGQQGELIQTQQGNGNHWHSASASIQYTHRINSQLADTYKLDFNTQDLQQQTWGTSEDWWKIFETPSEAFRRLQQDIQARMHNLDLHWTRNQLVGKTQLNWALRANQMQIQSSNRLGLYSDETLPPFLPDDLSHQGKTTSTTYKGSLRSRFSLKPSYGLSSNVAIGWSEVNQIHEGSKQAKGRPTIEFSTFFLHPTFIKKLIANVNLSYSQLPFSPRKILGYYYPSGLESYSQSLGDFAPLDKNLSATYQFNYLWNTAEQTNLSVSFNKGFGGFLNVPQYVGYMYFGADSLVQKGRENLNFNLSNSFASLTIKSIIRLNLTYNISLYPILHQGEIHESQNHLAQLRFTIKRNWNQKIFVEGFSTLSRRELKQAEVLNRQIQPAVSDFRVGFYNRNVMYKGINLTTTGTFIQNNLLTDQRQSYFLLDAGIFYNFPNRPFNISLKASNLTNQSFYYLNFSNEQSQSFRRIPLIQRNVFVSLRYEI